jgi:hypothetical protein
LNEELARYLRERPAPTEPIELLPSSELPVTSCHAPRWRVRDRLSESDVAALIALFKAGTPKHVLAERYGIGIKSVKALLREHGVGRRSRRDIVP